MGNKNQVTEELEKLLKLPHEESHLPIRLLIMKVCLEKDVDSLKVIKESYQSLLSFVIDEIVTLLENIEREFKL